MIENEITCCITFLISTMKAIPIVIVNGRLARPGHKVADDYY
jgi:hypothetical protein